MTSFSWKKTQKKVIRSRLVRIAQLEKMGKGDCAMKMKLKLKKLKRRIELQETVKNPQDLRREISKIV